MPTQYQSPIATTVLNRWTPTGDTTAHACTDDLFLDPHDGDTTYVVASYPNTNASVRVKLEPPPEGDPDTTANHQGVISVRRTTSSATNPTLLAELWQGDGVTLIASNSYSLGAGTIGTYVGRVINLTPTEAGNITDYSNLYYQLTVTAWSTTADSIRVSSIELRTPVPGGNKWIGPSMWNS